MGHLNSFRPVTTTPNIMTATHDQYRIWRSEQFPSERFDEWLKIFRSSGLDRFTAFTRRATTATMRLGWTVRTSLAQIVA
jgi:hypothetical protein